MEETVAKQKESTMRKAVCYVVDLSNPPLLTDAQKAELMALASTPEDEVYFSDVPPLDEAFWKGVMRNPFHKANLPCP